MKRATFLTSLLTVPFISFSTKSKVNLQRRIWEEKDITAGLYVTRAYQNTDIGNMACRTFQIGYDHTYECKEGTEEISHKYTMISVADGWSHGRIYEHDSSSVTSMRKGYSKRDLVRWFNRDDHGFRPTTKEEMHQIIDRLSKNFLCTT